MRDGVELVADHYAPKGTPVGTLLVRGPYGRGFPSSALSGRIYAERGYHVLLQSCRGTFGSGGRFDPMVQEIDDGADTVGWLRTQPWFTGRFATVGQSYVGFTQWALLMDPPPELAAAVIDVAPHDFSLAAYGTGAFALHDFLTWSDVVAHQEETSLLSMLLHGRRAQKRMAAALGELPLCQASDGILEGRAPWYEQWLSRPDISDPYWQRMRLGDALERCPVPVLLHGGWQDLFLEQTLHQYEVLHSRGIDVALTVGPWTHLSSAKATKMIAADSLEWLGEHLAGTRKRTRDAPVRIFTTGAETWRDLPAWPPPTTDVALYLDSDRALVDSPPDKETAPSRFTYDPKDPTPTIGGRIMARDAGYRDDTGLADRTDILTFTGPPLTDDLEVLGTPRVELAHSTDNPHADVFVRLSEVDPKGRSHNISDGYLRLDPASPATTVNLALDATAHRFRAGNRIRLTIGGGSHPRFNRNPGTGEPPATATRLATSTHTIAHDAERRSVLYLPTSA
nr:CocE/NonD family hydrolase [Pseudofrankia inefficax]